MVVEGERSRAHDLLHVPAVAELNEGVPSAVLPLAEVFAIEFTTPIWTALIAALFLGEAITKPRIAAFALGFIGTLVILRPGVTIIQPAALAMLAIKASGRSWSQRGTTPACFFLMKISFALFQPFGICLASVYFLASLWRVGARRSAAADCTALETPSSSGAAMNSL